jgi:hypothetical protein
MSPIILVQAPITRRRLKEIAEQRFGDMVKGVVDLEKQTIALGGELHADEEAILLRKGSAQKDLWGINLYPDLPMPAMLEFDSMINIRPSQNNPTRSVEDPTIRQKITALVAKLVIV